MGSAVQWAADTAGGAVIDTLADSKRGTTSTSADVISGGNRKKKDELQRNEQFRLANESAVNVVGMSIAGAPLWAGIHDSMVMDPRRAEEARQNQADAMLANARSAVGDSAAEAPAQADLTAIARQRSMRGRRGTILTGGSTLGGSSQGKTLLGM